MPLLAAAVVPHSPLLLPTISKDHTSLGKDTRQAVLSVSQHFHQLGVTDLIILSPHAVGIKNSVVFYSGEEIRGDLKQFGDLSSFASLPAPSLLQALVDRTAREGIRPLIRDGSSIDYGVTVPLQLMNLANVRVLPVATSLLPSAELIRFGRILYEVMHRQSERVGLLASSDFSRQKKGHDHNDRPTALERDIAHALMTRLSADLPSLSRQSPCGLAPLVPFLSALDSLPGETDMLCVESPFGIWYMTVLVNLS